MTAAGWPGVRRATEWGKRKYAGSLAEDLWRRLDVMDVINRGMLFAATLLLCFFPFLIVASAMAGRSVVHTLARFTGLNSQAAADAGHLFASPTATSSAVVGTTSMLFFVFGGIAAATALQEIYELAFDLPHRGMKDIPRRLAWLAVLIGASLLGGWAGHGLLHAGGPALLAAVGLAWATGFWWLTMRILLAGRISWRALFPAACATGVLYVAMEVFFSLFFSAMVISDDTRYGPIGIIFALLSYLIAIGVVVILGAVAGLVWHERSSGKDQAGWLAFLRGLAARGLSGVQLVISDCHHGLRDAIAAVLPGASWQRCRAHYARNLATKVPKSAQPWVATLVRTIFEQPDAASVRAQHAQVVTALEAKFPAAATHLDDARDDILAFTAFPREIWRQIWSNNPQERLNKEIRRRTDVVGIFPSREAIIRLVGAVLAEQNDEWTEGRRYMGIEILAACKKTGNNPESNGSDVTIEAIGA
jgi:hypothetical protein